MDTQKIRTILMAARNKSLRKTAEALAYTPSALSHMADSLEKELGVELLKRTPHGVELSECGERLREKLRAVIEAEEELKRAAAALSRDREESLRIGTYFSVSFFLLPEIIREFKRRHPHISISISVEDTLSSWLRDDLADIVFTDMGEAEGQEWVPFMKDRYLAVLPDSILPGKEVVEKEELYPYTYISVNDSSTKRYIEEEKFKRIVKFSATDDLGVLALVREGIGVAILPSLIAQQTFSGTHTALIEPEFNRVLGFSYKKDNQKDSLLLFVRFLREYYGDVGDLPRVGENRA